MKTQYNYHTHTKRCGHAIGSDEEYVLCAIKAGYKIIGFSDHAPFRLPQEGIRMHFEKLGDYINSIKYLKNKYKKQIRIISGLECEFYKSQLEDIINYRKTFDFLLLGHHFQEHLGKSNFHIDNPDDLMKYAYDIEEACNSNLFDVIVHPDIFMICYPKWDEYCTKASNIIIDAAIKNDIPLELNCGGIKRGKLIYEDGERYPYPHYNFFKIAKEKNAKIILGLDIHNPMLFIDETYENETLSIVKDLNINIPNNYDLLKEAKKRKKKFFKNLSKQKNKPKE